MMQILVLSSRGSLPDLLEPQFPNLENGVAARIKAYTDPGAHTYLAGVQGRVNGGFRPRLRQL